jgi:hypothetical protein
LYGTEQGERQDWSLLQLKQRSLLLDSGVLAD